MSWLGRSVVWVDEDMKLYAGIVVSDNRLMNEVLINVFEPYRFDRTVRGIKQDGPWDYMPRDCWLAQDYPDDNVTETRPVKEAVPV